METQFRKLQPKQKGPIDERPHAPSPVHPDDIPFDPEAQRRWEESRGIHKKKPAPKSDDGVVDFNIDFTILKDK